MGTAHYEGLVVVETHRADTASGVGQLIVMNRKGSLVVKDEKPATSSSHVLSGFCPDPSDLD